MDSAASLALEWWDRWLRQLILTEHAIISLLAGSKSFSSLHLMLVAYFTWHFLETHGLGYLKRSILSNPAGWFFCPETLPESGDFFWCLRKTPPWSWKSRSRSLAPGFGLATLGSAQKVEGRGHRHCRVGMGWVGSLGRAKRAGFFFLRFFFFSPLLSSRYNIHKWDEGTTRKSGTLACKLGFLH